MAGSRACTGVHMWKRAHLCQHEWVYIYLLVSTCELCSRLRLLFAGDLSTVRQSEVGPGKKIEGCKSKVQVVHLHNQINELYRMAPFSKVAGQFVLCNDANNLQVGTKEN